MVPIVTNTIAAATYSIYVRKKHAFIFKGEHVSIGSDYAKRIIRYSTPLMLLDLTSNFSTYAGNVFLLGILSNLENVAYFDIPYSFVMKVFSQIWVVIGSVGIVSLSEVNYSNATKINFAVRQYVKIISLYVLPVIVGGFVLAEQILGSLYGGKVLPSVFIFRILLLTYGVLTMFDISNVLLNVKEKTYITLMGGIVKSITVIALSLYLIPKFGVIGATISTIISSTIVGTYSAYFVISKVRIGNYIPLRSISRYLIAALLMGVVISTIFYFIHTSWILLLTSLLIGPLTYALALKYVRAFDQKDKELFANMKIPLKSVILKFFWKE